MRKPTEAEEYRLMDLRCKGKRGEQINDEDMKWIAACGGTAFGSPRKSTA